MSKKAVSDIVAGAGLLSAIFTSLSNEVTALHGNEEDWHRLSRPDGQATIRQIARLIANVFIVPVNYDVFCTPDQEYYTKRRSGIKNVTFKYLTLDHDYTLLEIRDMIAPNSAMRLPELCEAQSFHTAHPEIRTEAPIVSLCGCDDHLFILSGNNSWCGMVELELTRKISKKVRVLVVLNIE